MMPILSLSFVDKQIDNICIMGSGSNCIPIGIVSSKTPYVPKVLDQKRWSRAEARAAELIAQIQPNYASEAHRNAVVFNLQCLIMNSVPCQVFTFGSVPLKTYLPDGDIDLAVFAENQHSEDRLIQDVRNILENQGTNEDSEFHVKEVQYIQGEVKIIKCLIENFVVDISFNQIDGLGTLCFLEEVLFQFLNFFSKFDWNKYCISLRGPVPIRSLPKMKAEPPRYARKNCPELLLSEKFLDSCESNYGVKLSYREIRDKPFVCKHLNIVDPLRANNNLGRSISRGNFCRIKGAFSLGAKRIERLLSCTEDNIIAEFDLFFTNSWDRNGNGYWVDTETYNLLIRNKSVETSHEYAVEQPHGVSQNPDNHSEESKQMSGTSDVIVANTMNNKVLANRGQSPTYSSNEAHDMHHFPEFYFSSEFSHLYGEAPSHHHHNTGFSSEIQQSYGQISDDWRSEHAFDPENTSSGYYYDYEYDFGVNYENVFPTDEAMLMHQHQEEFGFPNLNEYQQAAVNVNSSDVPFPPPPPHVLASGYMHENSFGVLYGNWIDQSTIGTDLRENTSTESTTSRVQALQLGSSQRDVIDNKNFPPVEGGSSGPSFQVPTMFPFYNLPTETTFAATNYDILDGDFETHYMNLQYGRLCKNPKSLPMHLREQFPWYGKPKGVFNIEEHAHPPVRVMLPQRASRLRGNTNQSVGFWLPRFSDGTGTFFPKPSSSYHELWFWRRNRLQQDRYIEYQRYERKDNNGEREHNLFSNSEARLADLGQYKLENPGSNESSQKDERKDKDGEREQNLFLNSERMFPSLGRYKFENPGSNESSNQGESSHSGTSKVPNIGTGRDSKSSSTQQPSSSKNP
ncbi:hypothetical protein GmHk_06G015828 [Glycine max]|nr:hypothetical protein GmHk_06G015828 [Glycine max]